MVCGTLTRRCWEARTPRHNGATVCHSCGWFLLMMMVGKEVQGRLAGGLASARYLAKSTGMHRMC